MRGDRHAGEDMKRILLSQLLALIKVSFDTKSVTVYPNSVIWAKKPDDAIGNQIELRWKRGQTCGSPEMWLCLQCERFEKGKPIFNAYYFNGDNCNDRSRFLYFLMAEDTDIIDDIALTGANEDVKRRTNLLKINPFDYEVQRKVYKRWKEE